MGPVSPRVGFLGYDTAGRSVRGSDVALCAVVAKKGAGERAEVNKSKATSVAHAFPLPRLDTRGKPPPRQGRRSRRC